jgi:hypothetical protein
MLSMWLSLLTLLTTVHAAPVGGSGQRFGIGLHAGMGAGFTAKLYVGTRFGLSASAGTWGLLIRRQSLLVEFDAYSYGFARGTLVATAGLGLAREYDGFWRDTTHLGVRVATSALWRWHDHPFEIGSELGLDLYNYDPSNGQFGELPTVTAVLRWYPHFGS